MISKDHSTTRTTLTHRIQTKYLLEQSPILLHFSPEAPFMLILRMPMQAKFWRHLAVFAANVSQELNTLLRIIRCELATSKFVSHLHSQEVCKPGFTPCCVPTVPSTQVISQNPWPRPSLHSRADYLYTYIEPIRPTMYHWCTNQVWNNPRPCILEQMS